MLAQTLPLYANPIDGVVSAGSANIDSAGNTLTVTQQTDKAVIDWRGFDIAHGETTEFKQPNASSMTLNRVNSNAPSFIDGNLTANGNLIVVNPNGVWFGGGARVDVNGLIASTAGISNDAFMNASGTLNFDIAGNPDAGIVNDGLITAKEAGLVGLVAPNVVNRGIILARLGRVALASGDTATVDMYGDGLVNVAVSDAVKSQLVSNSGLIVAEGGTIALTAAAGKNIVNSLISVSGELAAPSVSTQNGKIIIAAAGSNKTAKQGYSTVLVSGILDASGRNAGERGGSIVVTGDNVGLLSGTRIDASGSDGLSGTTLGKLVSAIRTGSAGGDIRIGGDYLGQGDTPTALNLYVDSDTLILNDAINSGDAGRTIFWSDNNTQFYGNVYARALSGNGIDQTTWHAMDTKITSNTGDGGFVETSGHHQLDAGGYVDLTASNGARGTYFLDPTNITIYGNFAPNYATVIQGDSTALSANLKLWLDAADTTKVNLTYSALTTAGANACASSCLTASGTSGATTITTSANIAASLQIGQRIRLGSAGSVTAASTLGADTYTVTAKSGTTITLSSALTTTYTSATVYGGYVSQLTDKSGTNNNNTQASASLMPLWVSNGENGIGVAKFDGVNDFMTFATRLTTIRSAFFNINSLGNPQWTPILGDGTTYDFHGSQTGTNLLDTANSYSSANIRNGSGYVNGLSTVPGSILNSSTFQNIGLITLGNVTANSLTHDRNITGRDWNGNYGEVILYDAALSNNARNLIEQYQSAKWGIALTPPGSGATEAAQATASIQKGDAVDGYSAFTTRYLERLSQSANISLQSSNNITLDLQGDTLNFATSGRSLTLTAGNQITTASTGTITTNNGNISMTATSGILFNNAVALNTNGGNITLNSPVTLGANVTLNSGTGTTTVNTVNGNVAGTRNLTVTAGTITLNSAIGSTTALGALSLTATNSLTLPSITAASINIQTTAATADISSTTPKITATGAGGITLNSARDINLSTTGLDTSTSNGPISITAVGTANLAPISTGTGNLTITANNVNLYGADIASGLVSSWSFDEGSGTTSTDSSGSGNTAVLTNGPTWSTNTHNGSGYSISFDGVNDYVNTGLNNLPTIQGSKTISLWYRVASNPASTQNLVALESGGSSALQVGFISSTNIAAWKWGGTTLATVADPVAATWHNIIYTYDGLTSSIYVDGTLANSSNTSVQTGAVTSLNLGRYTGGQYFSGLMDDVNVYNTNITAGGVNKLYSGTNTWNVGTTTINASNNVNLDLKGDVIAGAAGKNISITAGNNISSASAGTITAAKSAGVGGDITMTATAGTLNTSNLTLTSTGGAATLNSAGAMNLGNISAGTLFARASGGASDVTLTAGKVLTASGTGTPLTLVAGRNFINNAGAGALSTPSGRWLVYSNNPTNDTIGGLSNSFRRFNCTYSGSCPSMPATGNGLLYRTTPTITATPNAITLTYGDALSLSNYAYSLTGYLGSDATADSITGTLSGGTNYTQGASVNSYSINYLSGSLASSMGYAVSYTNNASAISVTPRSITISANNIVKSYGSSEPALGYSISGLTNSEAAIAISGSLARTSGTSAGIYSIIQNTLRANSNYSMNFVSGTFTITGNSIPVTVTRVSQDPTLNMPKAGGASPYTPQAADSTDYASSNASGNGDAIPEEAINPVAELSGGWLKISPELAVILGALTLDHN